MIKFRDFKDEIASWHFDFDPKKNSREDAMKLTALAFSSFFNPTTIESGKSRPIRIKSWLEAVSSSKKLSSFYKLPKITVFVNGDVRLKLKSKKTIEANKDTLYFWFSNDALGIISRTDAWFRPKVSEENLKNLTIALEKLEKLLGAKIEAWPGEQTGIAKVWKYGIKPYKLLHEKGLG